MQKAAKFGKNRLILSSNIECVLFSMIKLAKFLDIGQFVLDGDCLHWGSRRWIFILVTYFRLLNAKKIMQVLFCDPDSGDIVRNCKR